MSHALYFARQRRQGDLVKELMGEIEFQGAPSSERVKLTEEALWYARRNDLSEAEFRLRLRDKPKWKSIEECGYAYKRAMDK